ncbi:9202_t:CDS:2 [Funneliformis caledonium]|uniref:9202_t:CDS:1 n=1 Tax=Funneliformis caledonium TaxID=1117310 RepID=A0A9N9BD92_9GLOM|nr:9202_t:CDS:2 [Funneliformis caledonium]
MLEKNQKSNNPTAAESSNITQPPVIIMKVDQTSEITPSPLDKEKNKETDTVIEISTNNITFVNVINLSSSNIR